MAERPSLLLVTDTDYVSPGRNYGDEDIWLAAQLAGAFQVSLAHPIEAIETAADADVVLVRNSGPVLHYQADWDRFRTLALHEGWNVYNPLTGRGDMAGKQYLIDLTRECFPVIPTVDDPSQLDELPAATEYIVKPKGGADSLGLQVLPASQLKRDGTGANPGEVLIQPFTEIDREISFVFVDDAFQYAVATRDQSQRWDLVPYEATTEDIEFARRFLDWNTLDRGIQRIDAALTAEGRLLLVELEDLNPFLSLDRVSSRVSREFASALVEALRNTLTTT